MPNKAQEENESEREQDTRVAHLGRIKIEIRTNEYEASYH